MTDSTSEQFFDAVYGREEDPWGFKSDPYERARYRRVLDLLGPRRFFCGFEPGCSVGELTALLAPRCERLVATDFSAVALERARLRLAAYAHVDVRHADLGAGVAGGPFDLVAFCEIGYYFSRDELLSVIDKVVNSMALGGMLVATHWTGVSADHVLSGQQVHHAIKSHRSLAAKVDNADCGYIYGLWERL